jgi:hypothetical protein
MAAKKAKGRPAFEVTPALRRRVSIAAGAGMSHEAIAKAIGACRDTLEKHFAEELQAGAYQRRLEVLEALYQAATRDGSVAAAKAFLALEPAAVGPKDGEEVKPVPKTGKKEQANRDAVSAPLADPEWSEVLGYTPSIQ